MAYGIPSFGSTDLLNSTAGTNTSAFWNPADTSPKWGISNPASSAASTGGNMPFPWMAAATIGSAGLNFLGQRSAASSQAKAGGQAMQFQKGLFEAQQEAGADLLAAQFGASQMAADADYARQLRGSIDSLNLMNSAPYINNMTRQAGFRLAGQLDPDQVSRFAQMFGGA